MPLSDPLPASYMVPQTHREKRMGLFINHRNVQRVFTALDFTNGVIATTITIETDLALNSGDPAFDGRAVQALVDAVMLQAGQRGFSADTFRLVEVRNADRT
jgi:hypothetical protein